MPLTVLRVPGSLLLQHGSCCARPPACSAALPRTLQEGGSAGGPLSMQGAMQVLLLQLVPLSVAGVSHGMGRAAGSFIRACWCPGKLPAGVPGLLARLAGNPAAGAAAGAGAMQPTQQPLMAAVQGEPGKCFPDSCRLLEELRLLHRCLRCTQYTGMAGLITCAGCAPDAGQQPLTASKA